MQEQEYEEYEPEDPQETPSHPGVSFTLGQKAAVFVPTALAVCGADALLHAPLPLAVGGVIGAYVLARHSPQVYEALRDALPLPERTEQKPQHERHAEKQVTGDWTVLDRLLGNHLTAESASRRSPLPKEDRGPEQDRVTPDLETRLEQIRAAIGSPRRGPLAGHLYLGEQFNPHADTTLSNRIVILGMPGAGKSNTVAVIAEELARLRAPFIIFDQKPEYGRMTDYFPNGVRADARTLTPANAYQYGQFVMENRRQVVLNLRSYKDDNTAARVMIALINSIWAWEEALDNDHRIPCTFILDEAHYWLPQSEQLSTVSRVKDKEGRSLFTCLQQAFFNVVNGGRSFGLGMVISTQRPANVDNRAIAVAEWRILLKANMPNDLKVYRSFGVADEVAMSLGPGQAYIIGPGDIRGTYQLRRRYTPDDSKTPGLAALQGKPDHAPLHGHLADLPGSEQALPEPAAPTPSVLQDPHLEDLVPASETRLLPETEALELLRGNLSFVPTQHFTKGLPPILHCAYEVFQSGMSPQDLAGELGVDLVTARRYLRQLKERRYIDHAGQKLSPPPSQQQADLTSQEDRSISYERGSVPRSTEPEVVGKFARSAASALVNQQEQQGAQTSQKAGSQTSQASNDGKSGKSDEKAEKYRFSDQEQARVIDLYKAYGNIDKVLAHMGRGAHWYKHASEILKEAGLHKDRKRG